MDPRPNKLIALLAAAALALAAFGGGYLVASDSGEASAASSPESSEAIQLITEAFEKIRSTAVDPPSEGVLARGAIRGMIRELRRADDPHALFYTPKAYRSFRELTTGRFSGIGVWLKEKQQRLEIVSVLPESPALHIGLKRGDIIEAVDGEPVSGMPFEETVAKIKGPEGTTVDLEIDRNGAELTFQIARAEIELPSLRSSMNDDELGFVRLFGFANGAGEQLRERVKRLISRGAEGIVLDLRDNGGGLFAEAVEVANVFVGDGEIVTYKQRAEDDVVYEASGDAFDDIPLVVLVNEGTASAAEIVAGALQDQKRAIVVGAKTYGKGSVQEVVPLFDASALKLTTGAYLTPNGSRISDEGIDPDVVVDARPPVQRERAAEILRGIILSATDYQG
jgi:carboxyl-terminal processing protease